MEFCTRTDCLTYGSGAVAAYGASVRPAGGRCDELARRGIGRRDLVMTALDRATSTLAEIKGLIRDLGDMACIGCRANTCPACGLAAEITHQVHLLADAACTGTGSCDRPLDAHGECDRQGAHA